MDKKSAILLFLSDYKEKGGHGEDEEKYRYEKVAYNCDEQNRQIYVSGSQTNDAPLEALLSIAKQDGTEISKIFCIVTWDTFTKPIIENASVSGKTSYLRFKERIKKIISCESDFSVVPIYEFDFERIISDGREALLENPDILRKIYDNQAENLTISNTDKKAFHVYRQLAESIQKSEITDIYIDYTGGFRDTSFLMVTVIRYLEFSGIHCKDIIYSQYIRGAKMHQIHDIQYI